MLSLVAGVCMSVEETCRWNGDGNGTDTGECSTIDFTRYVFPLLFPECTEERTHVGNTERGVVIYSRIRMWYLWFTYTPVFTVNLILVRAKPKSESERMNE